ncbi:helix-turn-helix transcriptional regulator [Leifsonia poae]|uniref:helix-turn-helix transcriptional regulator n=1 Tax=Leifsonia poae TaxID=110933 RepID=UPI001CBA804E|nr:HTH domain-containing protein [Leifsonia poae]
MWDTTSRTFVLLGMLQRSRFVASDRLAVDLGVTTRTVRRDVARVRDLGYPIDARLGVDGGYSLEPGAVLPPIFLSTDEALACVLALRRW